MYSFAITIVHPLHMDRRQTPHSKGSNLKAYRTTVGLSGLASANSGRNTKSISSSI